MVHASVACVCVVWVASTCRLASPSLLLLVESVRRLQLQLAPRPHRPPATTRHTDRDNDEHAHRRTNWTAVGGRRGDCWCSSSCLAPKDGPTARRRHQAHNGKPSTRGLYITRYALACLVSACLLSLSSVGAAAWSSSLLRLSFRLAGAGRPHRRHPHHPTSVPPSSSRSMVRTIVRAAGVCLAAVACAATHTQATSLAQGQPRSDHRRERERGGEATRVHSPMRSVSRSSVCCRCADLSVNYSPAHSGPILVAGVQPTVSQHQQQQQQSPAV